MVARHTTAEMLLEAQERTDERQKKAQLECKQSCLRRGDAVQESAVEERDMA